MSEMEDHRYREERDWRLRIEDKLEKLADAVVALARVEERQDNHFREINRLRKGQDKHEERIASLEQKVGVNKTILGVGQKTAFVLLSGFVGLFFWWLRGKLGV